MMGRWSGCIEGQGELWLGSGCVEDQGEMWSSVSVMVRIVVYLWSGAEFSYKTICEGNVRLFRQCSKRNKRPYDKY